MDDYVSFSGSILPGRFRCFVVDGLTITAVLKSSLVIVFHFIETFFVARNITQSGSDHGGYVFNYVRRVVGHSVDI